MEEVSNLDSFHADETDAMRSKSVKNKEDSNTSAGSNIDKPVGDKKNKTDAMKESSVKADSETTFDDDLEQISDGTFEIDDESSQTSVVPSPSRMAENSKKPTAKVKTVFDVKHKAAGKTAHGTEADAEAAQETDFEEVDTNVSAGGNALAEESDMLGESDMTLPLNTEKTADDAETDKSGSVMEVDNEQDAATGDAQMTSPNSKLENNKLIKKVDEQHPDEDIDDTAEQADEHASKPNTNDSKDEVDAQENNREKESDNTKSHTEIEESIEAASPGDDGATAKNKSEENADDSVEIMDGDAADNMDDEEVDQEDEPVENVLEPEESDVCLIPDDTETQMTEEEKEQAILARENAEKEDAEAEAVKEKESESAKSTETVDEEGEVAENEAKADAEAQANQAGADAAEVDSGSKDDVPVSDAVDAQDVDEPLLEEMQNTTDEGGEVKSKIIIAWIVSSLHKCKQCEKEKQCGFHFRNPENIEWEYVCNQKCCETLMSANPGKYFMRRKKYLVEELGNDANTMSSNDGTPTPSNDSPTDDVDRSDEVPKDLDAEEASAAHVHDCLQCRENKLCKYFFKQDDDTLYICNDNCYNLLSSEEPEKFKLKRHSIRVRNIGGTLVSTVSLPAKKSAATEPRVVTRTTAEAEAARLERAASFTRRCAECFNEIALGDKNLLWETMDFCNEICLGKYQRNIGSNCQTCHGEVPHPALGKYCVRFGFDIRQFCCAACLNEYKKGLKTCSCCQKDISSGNEGFLAPVGDKEQFKDFCSQACMRRYDSMCNPRKKPRNDMCAVCNIDKPVRVEIMLDEKEHTFCSNPCFSAFKFVSNIVADQCGMCCKYFERKGSESFTIYTERRAKVFCSRICLNVYIIVNRRIVSCQWCKVKKYNFDMIYKQQDAQEILMCSLNCLTLYGVSINAFSRTVAKCDNCNNSSTPQYHLTMSDASMRNFCTYQCVMQFQSQFARAPLTLENETPASQQKPSTSKNTTPFPTGLPKRVKLKVNQVQVPQLQIKLPVKNSVSNKKGPTMPVISTVSSLASGETETMIGNVTVRRSRGRGRKLESPPPPLPTLASTTTIVGSGRGRPRKTVEFARSPSPTSESPSSSSNNARRGVISPAVSQTSEKLTSQTETKIITVPPYPPSVRNVQVSCKPQNVTVGFQIEPQTTTTGTQTGKDYSNKVLIPVPVPIYVPVPMYMYSLPFPVPVPIPLPIPVPIFIPTTRNSAEGILKEIKKIQDKMPADPFEAELLMMAEMVAEEKRETDSDSDEEIKPEPGIVNIEEYSGNVQVEVATNSYGEDVLQMALKMATGEYDQPSVDLESAMQASTITNPPPGLVTGHEDSMTHMSHMQQSHHMLDSPRGRARKRGSVTSPVSPRNSRSPVKRQRVQEMDNSPQSHGSQAIQIIEKPDANMCLKYTFGVNAWKQWVMTKNADIEKSTVRRRTFKTELLQMTADELNYSLCLFVKEVRKPNGTEYAPDTIYYLVLGIQQYLYENGRIDNIFTDPYYERFTDCLDEVARKFSVLYNDSQYIVTRVEEEHLWECKQLGAHSPHVLLSTLMFFNTKHFNLTTVEEHMQLSFSHIMKHWKRTAQSAKSLGTRNVLLRFYPPQAGLDANPRKKKVYEQQENEVNPLRCPVRLYEFYLSKCPESVKTRNDVFYLQPERSCVPDSPVWYSTQALSQESLQKMLHRVKMVKEINIALLTS